MNLESRLEKLEKCLSPQDEEEKMLEEIRSMSNAELCTRIATIVYKDLCVADPFVKTRTESEFIDEYLKLSYDEQKLRYINPLLKKLNEKRESK